MPASVLTVLFAMQSTVSNAEPRIGTAASTRPIVEAVAGGNTQKLSAGSEIYANQTVRTENRGMADLVFLDKTNLSVGPKSEVLLDKFVYDPTGFGGSVVFQATRGAFRFVTGSQANHAYQVSTPHGSLGVRGTVLGLPGPSRSPALAAIDDAIGPVGTLPRDALALDAVAAAGEGNQGTTVEILVNKPGEDCVTKLRLVKGKADYKIAKTGKLLRLEDPNKNNVVCIDAAGNATFSTSSQTILSFSTEAAQPPSTGFVPGTGTGSTPITTTIVSPTAPL
jgi:hypothetical protein